MKIRAVVCNCSTRKDGRTHRYDGNQ